MQAPSPRKRRAAGGWIVSAIALIEVLFALGILFWIRNGACAAVAPPLGHIFGGGTASAEPSPAGDAATIAPSQPSAPISPPAQSEAPASGSAQGANVSGDLKQVPDPNCVAKTAAGMLNSDQTSAPPSCPPMSPSPELQKAAQQVQSLGTPTP